MTFYPTPITIVAFVVFIVAFLIQLSYLLFVFSRLSFYKNKSSNKSTRPVSVVICARNELANLEKHLQAFLEQDYPSYQVVVVNDCSYDETGDFLKIMANKYKHLKVVTIEEQEKYQHGKKFALTLGIKAAENDILLLSDADCEPSSKHWLTNMQNHFVLGTDIVLGYGAYQKRNSLLNKLIRFDTFYGALQYLSFSLLSNTYMGVGRNLGYRKDLFFKNKGFASHYHLLSGDDDLFINEVANKTNTHVEISHEAFTISEPKTSFRSWFHQKKRHLSTSKLYKFKTKFFLGLLSLSQVFFYAGLVTLLVLRFDWQIVWGIYAARLVIQFYIFGMGMKKLKELDLLPFLPVLDVFFTIYYPILGLSSQFYKQVKWK